MISDEAWRPTVRVPHVACRLTGYTLAPCEDHGPVALIRAQPLDGSPRFTTIAHGPTLIALVAHARGPVNLAGLTDEDMAEVALVGWPEDWQDDHIAWSLVPAIGSMIEAGIPWSIIRKSVLTKFASTTTAPLN
jgi:hypothetical protein